MTVRRWMKPAAACVARGIRGPICIICSAREEILGPMLLTTHNLTYYQALMQGARQAILAGDYDAYCARVRGGWAEAGAKS